MNAYVIFNIANPNWKSEGLGAGMRKLDKRRMFLIAVGEALVDDCLQDRASNMHIYRRPQIGRAMASIGILPPERAASACSSADRKRGRCIYCDRAKEFKVTRKCCKCANFVCGKHANKTTEYTCVTCQ